MYLASPSNNHKHSAAPAGYGIAPCPDASQVTIQLMGLEKLVICACHFSAYALTAGLRSSSEFLMYLGSPRINHKTSINSLVGGGWTSNFIANEVFHAAKYSLTFEFSLIKKDVMPLKNWYAILI
jgi:hypothetical protein